MFVLLEIKLSPKILSCILDLNSLFDDHWCEFSGSFNLTKINITLFIVGCVKTVYLLVKYLILVHVFLLSIITICDHYGLSHSAIEYNLRMRNIHWKFE